MNAELIAVGTELLLGEISNTDGQYISRRLAEIGINVYFHTVVGDNPVRLESALAAALERSDVVITTGGLGPTCDDLTKEVVAKAAGRKLALHRPSLEKIRGYFAARGREMTENNIKQAYLPEGCEVFENDWGTAPGCAVTTEEGRIIAMLPGPPRECLPMTDYRLIPYLKRFSQGAIVSRIVRVFGQGESALEQSLRPLMEQSVNPTLAPYAKEGEVELRVTAKAETGQKAFELTVPLVERLKKELGGLIYGIDVGSLEEALLLRLKEKGLTLACAESCTGGLISKRITDLPGASEVFLGGVVSYSNDLKRDALGVPEKMLKKYGAVSAQAAVYMARGVAALTGCDIALSVTGIAGPGGGSAQKPVGLCYIGLCANGASFAREFNFGSKNRDRGLIRLLAASSALHMALKAAGRM
jgi:nicotinamide-nucleotide amidase